MTVVERPIIEPVVAAVPTAREPSQSIGAQALRSRRVVIGGGMLLLIIAFCVATLPLTLSARSPLYYDFQDRARTLDKPETVVPARWPPKAWYGFDGLGRSIFARCLLGGTISMAVGVAAATISVLLGVTVGLIAGFRGGLVDSALMRTVDILYGLPYILLVILFKIAFEAPLSRLFGSAQAANLVVLFSAIGLVSWLTMARVVRGQVLSLRGQPFIEATRAMGLPARRVFMKHILPNLVGPITVYATLTVPQAILQESFLSFLGVGVNAPLPTWGSLASEAVQSLSPVRVYWWMLIFPCILLVVTLLSLNFMGDGLRDIFDPKREGAKI
jgi:ABC-type dipeptide/oligopeptide/nickel transport system permease subunit